MGNKRHRINKRKVPKFKGNQFVKIPSCEEVADRAESNTYRVPLRPRPVLPEVGDRNNSADSRPFEDEESDLNVIFYFPLLKKMFAEFSRCQEEGCNSQLTLNIDSSEKEGLCQSIVVICSVCGFSKSFNTSRKQSNLTRSKAGKTYYDVNLRTVLAMREIGKGYEGLSKFCTVMNMLPPMSKVSYDNCVDEIHWAYELEKDVSLQKVALSVHDETKVPPTDISQCTVSLDGSWQTRGFSSINGVVTCMYGNKCIDYDIRSKHCKGCARWRQQDKKKAEYVEWKSKHVCPANHSGSSSSMEAAGALNIFKRSVGKYNLQYVNYLGDGDSSSFAAVQEAQPYGPDIIINKLECIGHIQKRIGSRLRDLKIKYKGQKLTDGKFISGKGRLTDAAINKLQNYFGIAVRENLDSIYSMKKCILASLFHNSSIEDDRRHRFCPRSKDSWCSWQKEKAEGKQPTFKPKLGIPPAICDIALPIYRDLTDDSILQRCLHGKTQNANEALHGLIWQRCPKSIYCGRKTLEVGVASAVCTMNDGQVSIKYVLERMNLKPGAQLEQGFINSSKKRSRQSTMRSSEKAKRRRKELRAIKKGWADAEKELEGATYRAGSF